MGGHCPTGYAGILPAPSQNPMSKLTITLDNHTAQVTLLHPARTTLQAEVDGRLITITLPQPEATVEEIDWLIIDGRPYELFFDPDLRWIGSRRGLHHLEIHDLEAAIVQPRSGDGRIKAPIPGLITRLMVNNGQTVEANQPLMILEAMKMENEIRSLRAGTVRSIAVIQGQRVEQKEVLLVVD